MSQTVARRIPIGPVQAYINHVRLGSPKSQAVLNWTYELAYGGTGDTTTQVNARKTNEQATIAVTIADLKASQLRYAFGQAKSLLSNSTIMTANYLTGTGVQIRRSDNLILTGTGTDTGLVSTPVVFVSASVAVYSGDYETEYVQGTDYGTAEGCDGIWRVTGCTGTGIACGSQVHIHYDAITTGTYARGGGAEANLESTIELVGKDAAGKYFQFVGWRAIREGAFNLQVNEKGEFPGIPLTYRLLGDLTTYTKGSQLFQIFIET
jgi:hypothetical protein